MNDGSDTAASIEAWRQTFTASLDVCADLTDPGWSAQTECPLWTVKDVCAHLVGGEVWMSQGHPAPADGRSGLVGIADRPVAERRGATGAEVLAELREVFALRQRQLAADPPDPAAPATTAYGVPVNLGILLTHRAFDGWVHEQDIRRALGRPGNLDAPGALIARDILLASLARVVAKHAAAPPGSVVRLAVGDPVPFDVAVTVDDNGRGYLAPWAGPAASTTLRMDWETYSRLAAGRIAPASAPVEVSGDAEVAAKVLDVFAVTP
ncbi:maleylpyruvate isomerase family mycothiol-dependent enzyme [Virgisporangium ochraceum]|uniref:Mycothiol-dependent maleylpyruvate isomerase metal-binding domain-containing protein n=1 Tax=Virgisporangium ochraceum TaxID=65505 RepID=A0A8J3ZTT4_9ACTN|nr:maleylpyruvate isomerase family mycothiol-dependent enzyme [Virgisporangium ochraceum]GIJ69764.1 hypothetical protein Voc01_046810 [Virgisporangium ochraceum]